MVAFELGDRGDGRELLTEERPERDEVVDQPVRRGPRQHRGPGLHITGHGAPDAVSRDDRQAFPGRGTRRAALGRLRELTALEQQLPQAEQPPVPLLERGSRRAGDLTEGGGEAVEYLGIDPGDRGLGPGDDSRHELVDDTAPPVVAPLKLPRGLPQAPEVLRTQLPDGGAHSAEVLGCQQVQVQAHQPGQSGPRQQRPRLAAAQVGEPGPCRPGHPLAEVGMLGEEKPGQAQPVAQGPVRESDLVAEPGVALEQQMVLIGGEAGNRSGHRPITARAAAYSAARCSSERCT